MPIVTVRRARLWLRSIEDQVSMDVSHEVQTSKSDLTARGLAVNLLKVASRVGTQCEAAEYKNLYGEESLPQYDIVVDDRTSH